ncbi:hypothetical protein [Propylenella binzhouense]|uniref:Uncharacterized protein n=1 Tax=Propylenella binzhouense TaxID=2555902 RepID=A0A964WTU1_9HYPH|nr:hypothetical protein [Propylenella binzhouense]MYZ48351.1 hypothetical protein [Propylenella binzhouense]
MQHDQTLINIFADMVNEVAYHIDVFYENDDIGILAAEDSTFINFRRATKLMRERGMPLSSMILHVERRISEAYEEAFSGSALPALDDD